MWYPGFLSEGAQAALLVDVERVIAVAPLFTPVMPKTGTPFSVRMTNCGALGWISDQSGYRYSTTHPQSGLSWPAMPATAAAAWTALSDFPAEAEACLINSYAAGARMGLHQDRDEQATTSPVVSLSLGDTCIFRYGGTERRARTRSIKLASGDALVIGGASRFAFHGVDRIIAGSSRLLAAGGRINLTLRRVTPVLPQ